MRQNLSCTFKGSAKLEINTIVYFGSKEALEEANQWSMFMKDSKKNKVLPLGSCSGVKQILEENAN